ncbi:uncharacterized protein EV420DRAFT_1560203 [Desarmillaria tabescens]|uniref:Uncharacterized protein n=1 Tax=Armillaria tabescens TaxID=1929756 RepID=A0AA39K0Q4_ARMTA|nr:uncharacterized protein EV420DRAFT_1560203 [Desarmillaria tabescens]KAK0451305.1 hypothetical protein EV420DRAFT_1560203 [Desarmillaria tabescens]
MTAHPTPQSIDTAPIFPPELMDQIIDALSDDVYSLTACAIASRQLVYRSRYHLFHAIRFKFIPHRSFNRCENISEDNVWYVGPSPTWVASEPQLPIALGMMKNLTTLRLVKVKLIDVDIIWPGIEELEINECSMTNLGTFLSGFHGLHKLVLRDVGIIEETSSSSGVSLDIEDLVITSALCSLTDANIIKCLLPLLSKPSRIRRLTYPLYYPEWDVPQYDVIPYTHLDELFLEGASNTEIPIPDIQNVTKFRLFVTSPGRWDPTDACKACDELTDWLIHLLYKAQGGCLKEIQLEYSLGGISGSPDKWAELDKFLAKMELRKVELVFSAARYEWDTAEREKANWPLWEGELEGLMNKHVAYFEEVKKRGLLMVSRRYR